MLTVRPKAGAIPLFLSVCVAMCMSSGTECMGGQTQAWLPVFPSTLSETESLFTTMYSINQRAELQLPGNLLFPLAILHELLNYCHILYVGLGV